MYNYDVVGEPADRASLFAKMVEVNKNLTTLSKSGKFRSGATKYEYATEADVIEPVSEAFANAGLAIIPSCDNQEWFQVEGRNGTQNWCKVEVGLTIGDSDTGAFIQVNGQSCAANGDKAPNAAFTTGLKYLLAKCAMVSFGDDADSFDGAKAAAVETVSKEKKSEIERLVAEHGIAAEVSDFIKKEKLSWSAMTNDDFDKILAYCKTFNNTNKGEAV